MEFQVNEGPLHGDGAIGNNFRESLGLGYREGSSALQVIRVAPNRSMFLRVRSCWRQSRCGPVGEFQATSLTLDSQNRLRRKARGESVQAHDILRKGAVECTIQSGIAGRVSLSSFAPVPRALAADLER